MAFMESKVAESLIHQMKITGSENVNLTSFKELKTTKTFGQKSRYSRQTTKSTKWFAFIL